MVNQISSVADFWKLSKTVNNDGRISVKESPEAATTYDINHDKTVEMWEYMQTVNTQTRKMIYPAKEVEAWKRAYKHFDKISTMIHQRGAEISSQTLLQFNKDIALSILEVKPWKHYENKWDNVTATITNSILPYIAGTIAALISAGIDEPKALSLVKTVTELPAFFGAFDKPEAQYVLVAMPKAIASLRTAGFQADLIYNTLKVLITSSRWATRTYDVIEALPKVIAGLKKEGFNAAQISKMLEAASTFPAAMLDCIKLLPKVARTMKFSGLNYEQAVELLIFNSKVPSSNANLGGRFILLANATRDLKSAGFQPTQIINILKVIENEAQQTSIAIQSNPGVGTGYESFTVSEEYLGLPKAVEALRSSGLSIDQTYTVLTVLNNKWEGLFYLLKEFNQPVKEMPEIVRVLKEAGFNAEQIVKVSYCFVIYKNLLPFVTAMAKAGFKSNEIITILDTSVKTNQFHIQRLLDYLTKEIKPGITIEKILELVSRWR